MPYTSDCVLQGFRYTDAKKERHASTCLSYLEVPPRFELGSQGFADPCLTAWPRHHINLSRKKGTRGAFLQLTNGAGDEARTRYLHLGKVALYRMSYTRISCSAFAEQVGASGRNRTNDTRIFSPLLYLLSYRGMLSRVKLGSDALKMATRNGLEPSTSSVTGWRANRLHHRAR